jgi:hypothetical protein
MTATTIIIIGDTFKGFLVMKSVISRLLQLPSDVTEIMFATVGTTVRVSVVVTL